MTVPVSDLQAVAPSAIIELFELALDLTLHGSSEVWRFHNGSNANENGAVIWNGNSYMRYPIECDGFEFSGKGTLPQPKLRIANIMGTITTLLLTANMTTPGNDLIGAKLTRIRTLAKYLDQVNFPGNVNPTADPTVELPREVFFISQKTAENRDVVEFSCSASFDLQGVRAPKRQCISNICQWVYRGTECGYSESAYFDANDNPVATAGQDICGKRLSSCNLRFGSISRVATYVAGSSTLTFDNVNGLTQGHAVYGLGIAPGTVISTFASGTTAVISAPVTISSNVSVAGTAAAAGTTIVVTNATGLGRGQRVTGLYIPAGTTVASISGTTVTVNQRLYSKVVSGTWNSQTYYVDGYYDYENDYYIESYRAVSQYVSMPTAGISYGMRAWGSNSIDATITEVGESYIRLSSYGSLSAPEGESTSAAVTLYFMPAAPASATYSFTAADPLTFRTTDGVLRYGSFPAVGLDVQ